MSEFINTLKELCEKGEIEISEESILLMYEYHKAVVAAPFNLTAIKEEKDSAFKHFYDSIVPYKHFIEKGKLVDVGCGGGFPCVPIAIMRRDIEVTALDASKKKCDFVRETCEKLGVPITVGNSRSEEWSRGQMRESYDICVARALGSLNVILELCVPLLKPFGKVYAYKGEYKNELDLSINAQKLLKVKCLDVIKIPDENVNHNILVFEKEDYVSDKFPRNFSSITKKPL